jgi:O-antigen/teichoic acid export membrane protein
MSAESKWAFFRQSGWLVIATATSGVFLMAVYSAVGQIADLSTFHSMLRLFTVLGIFTSGLQNVTAQDAASALTPEAEARLAAATRSVARAIFLFWLVVALVCALFHTWLIETLKIARPATLAITVGLVLAQLFLPFVQGLIQGAQKFNWLGWSIILNGLGRFVAIVALMRIFRNDATTALGGALIGLAAAVMVGAWPSRSLIFSGSRAGFQWQAWIKRAIPLSAGAGAIVFLMSCDVLLVQAHFSREQTQYYSAVAIVGVGLVTFTTPMASVMFPKLARSSAQSQRSDSLFLAVTGTAILGLLGALVCTVAPSLPLHIIYYKNPQLWKSAQLVPWFIWAMLPLTMANVLVGSLLAQRKFRVVPWCVLIAIACGLEMNRYLNGATGLEMFTAFKGVILRLGIFSSILLAVGLAFCVKRPEAQKLA